MAIALYRVERMFEDVAEEVDRSPYCTIVSEEFVEDIRDRYKDILCELGLDIDQLLE
jgi:hypothetical protein